MRAASATIARRAQHAAPTTASSASCAAPSAVDPSRRSRTARTGRRSCSPNCSSWLAQRRRGGRRWRWGDRVRGLRRARGSCRRCPRCVPPRGDALVEVTSSEVADDWRERWRSYHRPAVVRERLTVRPPWEPPGTTPLDVVIDPGQAFGTGAHATTRLCLELLLEVGPPGSLLDLGCGSGVLAIAAARLGFAPVVAVDNDPAAVAAANANAALNVSRYRGPAPGFALRAGALRGHDHGQPAGAPARALGTGRGRSSEIPGLRDRRRPADGRGGLGRGRVCGRGSAERLAA